MAVSIEQFSEYLTGADYVTETEDRPVVMMAKTKPKTGDASAKSLPRIFIPLGEAWRAKSSGLVTFRCMSQRYIVTARDDEGNPTAIEFIPDEWEFKTYNVGRFNTYPVEIPTVEA